jgi:hypothetical protein
MRAGRAPASASPRLIEVTELSPVLAVASAQKRCGKTTLLMLLQSLCARALLASNITPAALFRTIKVAEPTLLIDEADTFIWRSNELRGVLNAGHTRASAKVIRTVGEDFEPHEFRTFCAKGIAAIGRPGTVGDWSIIIRMQRKKPGELVERLRGDRIEHDLEPLRRRCIRWANDTVREILRTRPSRLKSAYVFPSQTGETPIEARNYMNRVFLKALKRAGIRGFRWHDLRHSFSNRLVMKGVDLRTVQELLGHPTITMTLRYSHLSLAHRLDAVQRLNAPPTGTATDSGKREARAVVDGTAQVAESRAEISAPWVIRTPDLLIRWRRPAPETRTRQGFPGLRA